MHAWVGRVIPRNHGISNNVSEGFGNISCHIYGNFRKGNVMITVIFSVIAIMPIPMYPNSMKFEVSMRFNFV